MNPWRSFVICPMIRQMLAEADGKDWSDVSLSEIRRLKPSLRKYYFDWEFCCSLVVNDIVAQKHPHRLQWNKFQHYTGTLAAPYVAGAKTIQITNDTGTSVIDFAEQCKVQNVNFAENETVHIFAKKQSSHTLAHYIVNDTVMRTMRYFLGNNPSPGLLEDYFELSSEEQSAFTALATQAELRRSALYAMAYLASAIASHGGTFASAELARAAVVYNSQICNIVHCVPIPNDWFLIFANNLFRHLPVREMGDLSVWQSKDIAPLAMFAILNDCSVWHLEGLTTASILMHTIPQKAMLVLQNFIPALLTPDMVDMLLDGIIREYPSVQSDKTDYDNLLFYILRTHNTLRPEHLSGICDILFKHFIYSNHVDRMNDVLTGPNGAAFRKYILDGYKAGCRNGVAAYHFCAAAITNVERAAHNEDPLDAALHSLNTAASQDAFLLNATCLSLILWLPKLSTTRRFTKEYIRMSEGTLDRLIGYLKEPDQLCYPLAANIICDLIINKLLDHTVLDDAVRLASVKALECADIRRRAEEILTLIPAKGKMLCGETRQLADRLKDGYLCKFQACLADPKYDYDPELLFAALCHLGAWESDELCWQQLNRVCDYRFASKASIHNEDKLRIQFLIKQYLPWEHFWPPQNTDIDPALLGEPLSSKKAQQLRQLSIQLADPGVSDQEITNPQDALDIIKHLKPYAYPSRRPAYPTAENLVKHIHLNIPSAGSLIIVSWFQLLCIYGLGDLAVEFYRKHKDMLDAPCRIPYRTQSRLLLYEEYKAFRTQHKRVVEGIHRSLHAGHITVLQAFMNSEYRPMVDCEAFINPLLTTLDEPVMKEIEGIYDGRFGTKDACRRTHVQKTLSPQIEELLRQVEAKLQELERLSKKPQPQQTPQQETASGEPLTHDHWTPSADEKTGLSPYSFYDDQAVLDYNTMIETA